MSTHTRPIFVFRSSSSKQRCRRKIPISRHIVLAVFLCCLFTSIVSPTAMASPVDQTAADSPTLAVQEDDGSSEEEVTEETPVVEETPVTEEPPVVDQTPVTEEAPDATLDGLQADPNDARIIVVMRECETTAGLSFHELDSACGYTPSIDFDVYGGGVLTTSGTNGLLDVSQLPGGQYTIREYVPGDYTQPSVYCKQGPVIPPPAFKQVFVVEGYYEFTLAPSDLIECHWFNAATPEPAQEYGTLWLYKLVCPQDPSFDFFAASEEALSARCVYHGNANISFNLYSVSNGQNQVSTMSGASASWQQVAGGEVSITESGWIGGGTPIVFCTPFGPFEPNNWQKADISGNTATFDLAGGKETNCHWFTVPQTAPHGNLGAVVSISTQQCDEAAGGVDIASIGYDELVTKCQGDVSGIITYVLTAGTAGSLPGTIDPSGDTHWSDVPAGLLTFTAVGADSLGLPTVYCSAYDPAALIVDRTFERVDVQDATFNYTLGDGMSLHCDWFDIPDAGDDDVADGTGSVTVVAYSCPKDLSSTKSFNVLATTCTAKREGATFKLDGQTTGNPGEQTTDATGAATWPGREGDHFYLYEQDVPDWFSTPIVYCDTYIALDGSVPTYDKYGVSNDPRIEFDLDDGESITCHWFAIPDTVNTHVATNDEASGDQGQTPDQDQSGVDASDTGNGKDRGNDSLDSVQQTGSITVFTWECPANTDITDQAANPWDTCTVSDAADLSLNEAAGSEIAATGNSPDGSVRWDDLATGNYAITSTTEDGTTGFVFSCTGTETSGNVPLYSTAVGAPLEITVEDGQHVVCFWFDVAAESGAEFGDIAPRAFSTRAIAAHL